MFGGMPGPPTAPTGECSAESSLSHPIALISIILLSVSFLKIGLDGA